MSTSESPPGKGPYLGAAFLCEHILTEKDNVKSAIRIIDRITRQAQGSPPPAAMEPFDHEVWLYVMFKSGWARGPMTLRITGIKPPPGESVVLHDAVVHFEGEEDRGVDLVARMMMRIEQPGIYWFAVELDGVTVTRVPMRVLYRPVTRRTAGPG